MRVESDQWLSRTEDPSWRTVVNFTSMLADLPLNQAHAFVGELEAVLERVREVGTERRPGSRRMRLAVLFFPTDEPA